MFMITVENCHAVNKSTIKRERLEGLAMTQQITVFGANGRVGRRVVAELLQRGDRVVAFVHSKTDLTPSNRLQIVSGDIYSPADVERALTGSRVVVSALGSWGTPRKDILTVGMTHIIPAMKRAGSATIVSLTGADARAPGDTFGIVHRLMHALLMVIVPKIMIDGEQHIALLAKSNLDWTVIRSPVMRSGNSGQYVLTQKRPLPWRTVAYDTVALAIVNSTQDRTWAKAAPYIH
jgi:putative NADH-flavin reductase